MWDTKIEILFYVVKKICGTQIINLAFVITDYSNSILYISVTFYFDYLKHKIFTVEIQVTIVKQYCKLP